MFKSAFQSLLETITTERHGMADAENIRTASAVIDTTDTHMIISLDLLNKRARRPPSPFINVECPDMDKIVENTDNCNDIGHVEDEHIEQDKDIEDEVMERVIIVKDIEDESPSEELSDDVETVSRFKTTVTVHDQRQANDEVHEEAHKQVQQRPSALEIATLTADPMSNQRYLPSKKDHPNRTAQLLSVLTTALLHVINTGSSVAAGAIYIAKGHPIMGGFGLVIAGISLIATNCFSLHHFRKQLRLWRKGRLTGEASIYHTERVSFVAFLVFHIFQFGLLYRILYRLHYVYRRKDCHTPFLQTDLIRKLRFFESFMESAPQTIHQVAIMTLLSELEGIDVIWITVVTALSSLASLVWVVRSHYKRFLLIDRKDRYKWYTETALFMSPLLTLTARIISIALFTTYYKWITVFPLLLLHWVVTVVEIIYSARRLRAAPDLKTDCIRCAVTIFVYLSGGERSIFGKFPWLYDIVVLIENTALFLAWFAAVGSKTAYGLPVASLVWGGYIIGVTLKLHLFDTKRLSKYVSL